MEQTKNVGPVWLMGKRFVNARTRRVVVSVPWNHWKAILDAVIPRGLEGPGYELHRAFRDPDWLNGGGCLYVPWAKEFGKHVRDAQHSGELDSVPREQIEEILSLCDTGHAIDFQSCAPEKSGRQGKKHRHLRAVK